MMIGVNLTKSQIRSFVGLCRTWPSVELQYVSAASLTDGRDLGKQLLVTHPDGRRWKMDRKGSVTSL
jgi:hypothetical protein